MPRVVTMLLAVNCLVAQISLQEQQPSEKPSPVVTLCDMVPNAGIYNGKTVQVSATLLAGIEDASVFIDQSCQPALDKTTQVLAEFSQKEYPFKSRLAKKLAKILKRSRQAKVTVVGVFTESTQTTPRCGYATCKLEIQRILSAEEVPRKR